MPIGMSWTSTDPPPTICRPERMMPTVCSAATAAAPSGTIHKPTRSIESPTPRLVERRDDLRMAISLSSITTNIDRAGVAGVLSTVEGPTFSHRREEGRALSTGGAQIQLAAKAGRAGRCAAGSARAAAVRSG